MRRTPLPVLLAAPALLAWAGLAAANPPRQCYGGGCLLMFQKLHQHGPLFNYGPYYGYPPFEPYGPWNAYLQYNPWYYGAPDGGNGRDRGGLGSHLRGLCGKHGCGLHACYRDGGWFKGLGCLSCGKKGHGAGHGAAGCSSCASPSPGCSSCGRAAADPPTGYAGIGDPSQSAVFYAGLPSLAPAAVVPAGR